MNFGARHERTLRKHAAKIEEVEAKLALISELALALSKDRKSEDVQRARIALAPDEQETD